MSRNAWKWTAALVVSLGLHAALAGTALMRKPDIAIAGGGTTELAIAGNAFEDQVAAGEVTDDVAPVEETPSELSPEAVPETVQAETVPEIMPETVIAALPEQSDTVQREEPVAEAEEVVTEPTETPHPPEEIVEPVETVEQLAAVVEIPRPTPRPEYTPKPVKAEPQPKAAPKSVAKQRASGSHGQDRQNAKRGASSADKNGNSANAGRQTPRASRKGNAEVSNYPGQIQARMQRAVRSLRKPRGAGQTMRVSVTISKNGTVSGATVARSSGSPAFDEKVLRTIRRVRYPPIPPAAGRNSWNFVVPVG